MLSTAAYGAFASSVNIHRINKCCANNRKHLMSRKSNSWERTYLPFQVLIFQGHLLLAFTDPEALFMKVQMHHTRVFDQNLPKHPISN